jgi:hypothetical protein
MPTGELHQSGVKESSDDVISVQVCTLAAEIVIPPFSTSQKALTTPKRFKKNEKYR